VEWFGEVIVGANPDRTARGLDVVGRHARS
jgi:hypothetical protein